jgi:hypothetical protein
MQLHLDTQSQVVVVVVLWHMLDTILGNGTLKQSADRL